jgi:peroxiredoxin
LKGRFVATVDTQYGPFSVLVTSGLPFTLEEGRAIPPPPRVGSVAPDFSLQSSGFGQVQLKELRGRPVILAFFCRCGRCHAVAKQMARTPQLAKRAQIYAIFGDTALLQPGEENAFRESTGFRAPFLVDPENDVEFLYDSTECPRLWVIDESGIVRYTNPTAGTPPNRIVADAMSALAGPGRRSARR